MGQWTRRTGAGLVGVLLLAATACGSAGDADSGSGDLEAVRVMMFPAQVYRLPAVVAQERGIFKEHGLDVEFVSQPPTLQGTQGLQATKANVAQLSTSTLAQGSQSGADVAFFCGGLNVIQTSLVAAPSSDLPATADGASWQEVLQSLEGMKIGIQTPVGSGVQLLFAAALKEAGVENVTYVNIGTDMKVAQASLGNGSIDVAQVTPPVLQTMVSDESAKQLLYLPDGPNAYKNNYGSAWTAPRSWLESDPKAAAAFCDAVTQGLEFIRDEKNRQAASALLQQDTGVPADVADKVLEDGVYDDFSTALEQSQVTATLDMYADLGIVKAKSALDVARLVSEPNVS